MDSRPFLTHAHTHTHTRASYCGLPSLLFNIFIFIQKKMFGICFFHVADSDFGVNVRFLPEQTCSAFF